jgi:hypothetical protein
VWNIPADLSLDEAELMETPSLSQYNAVSVADPDPFDTDLYPAF